MIDKIKNGEWLILARDRYRLDKLEEDLKIEGVYYERNDETSINKRIHQAILAWEDVRKGKAIDIKSVKRFYTSSQARIA